MAVDCQPLIPEKFDRFQRFFFLNKKLKLKYLHKSKWVCNLKRCLEGFYKLLQRAD